MFDIFIYLLHIYHYIVAIVACGDYMNKKILLGCIAAAFILITTSFTSVLGTTITKETNQKDSPLFTARVQRSVQKTTHQFSTDYLGKGRTPFIISKPTYQRLIAHLITMLDNKPDVVISILDKAMRMPGFKSFLQKNQINQNDFDQYVHRMQVDSMQFKQELIQAMDMIEPARGTNNPQPLALNTTNPFACVITIIALLPIFLILTIIIATITLVTCLNLNNCFENLFYAFIYQGLLPPQ